MRDDLPSSFTNIRPPPLHLPIPVLFFFFLFFQAGTEKEKLGCAYLCLYSQLLPPQLLLLNSCLEAYFSLWGLLISQMNNVPLHLPSSWRPADVQAGC